MDPNLVGVEVEIVGTGESQRGRSCNTHSCCGTALLRVGSFVCFNRTQFVCRDGEEEDVLEVNFLEDGLCSCKMGYLPEHLAFRTDWYDGLCAHVSEFYIKIPKTLQSDLSFIATLDVALLSLSG